MMTAQNNGKVREAVYGPLSVTDDVEENARQPKDSIVLYLSAFGACLAVVAVGVNIVWTSPVLWKLKTNNTDLNPLGAPISTYQVSLIAGLTPLGGIIGPFYLTKFCDIIGRRKTIMMLSTIMLVSEIGLAFSTHLYMYYVTRFVIGLCIGGTVASASVFVSEISENHNRGMIGCVVGLCFPIGNSYVYLVGPLFSVKIFTLFCTLPLILNLLCFMIFIPESPFYLASKKNKAGAIEALERIRNKNPSEIEKEYEKIVQTIAETSDKVEPTWSNMFRVRSLRKGFIIAVGLNALQQLSGVSAILAFAGPLFDASGAAISGDTTAILIGLVKVASVSLATAVIEKVGRRPLLLVSTLGGCIPHLLLGLFFHLKNVNSPLLQNIMWLPVTSVLLFIVSYSVGLGIIPTAIMSEIFPSNVKSKAASACTFTALFLIFIVTSLFPIMNELLGPSWCLWMFALCEFLGFLFVFFLVPEIKGKSITEVQEMLSK